MNRIYSSIIIIIIIITLSDSGLGPVLPLGGSVWVTYTPRWQIHAEMTEIREHSVNAHHASADHTTQFSYSEISNYLRKC